MLAASRTGSSSMSHIYHADHNNNLDDNHTSATEQASPNNLHDAMLPSPLLLPQASLADKTELEDEEHTIANADFCKRGLAPPVIESETGHALLVRSSIMATSGKESKIVDALDTTDTHPHPHDTIDQDASHITTPSNANNHTPLPPVDTTAQVSTTATATARAPSQSTFDDSKIDSAVLTDFPARPKVTWDDQAPRTFHGRRVSRDTFVVGQRRPSILLNGAASSSSSTSGSNPSPSIIGLNGTGRNKNSYSRTSSFRDGLGGHKTTTTDITTNTAAASNAKLFVIMLLSLCGGYVVIRTVREALGNWGVQGALMVVGAALIVRRSV